MKPIMSVFIVSSWAHTLAVFAQDHIAHPLLAAVFPLRVVLAPVLLRLPDSHGLAPFAGDGR
jgi:uncharacterized RDD family membrane protein YckC